VRFLRSYHVRTATSAGTFIRAGLYLTFVSAISGRA
jgi:hypothetical protein